MGQTQGAALACPIGSIRSILLDLEAFRIQQPRWMPYPIFRFIAERKARNYVEQALSDHPEFLDRLNGIQSGSGASFQNLCLLNSLETALSSLGDCTVAIGGCSAMAVRGDRSATGTPMIAKNFDYLPLIQPLYTLRTSQPTNAQRVLEFTAAPLTGTIDGVNESGLAITYNYAFTTDHTEKPAPPISVVIAEALRDCSTVEQAAHLIDSTPRSGGGILMMADMTGDIASLEVSNTRTCIRRPAAGEDVISHANCFRTDAMQDVQLPMDTVYTDRAPTPLRGRTLHNSSNLRDARFAELLSGNQAIGVDDLNRIMGDHGEQNESDDYTLCVHGSYWQTTASLQLLPANKQIRISYSTTCEADYAEFNLDP
jgi:predicted choloylglycine hydrolase